MTTNDADGHVLFALAFPHGAWTSLTRFNTSALGSAHCRRLLLLAGTLVVALAALLSHPGLSARILPTLISIPFALHHKTALTTDH